MFINYRATMLDLGYSVEKNIKIGNRLVKIISFSFVNSQRIKVQTHLIVMVDDFVLEPAMYYFIVFWFFLIALLQSLNGQLPSQQVSLHSQRDSVTVVNQGYNLGHDNLEIEKVILVKNNNGKSTPPSKPSIFAEGLLNNPLPKKQQGVRRPSPHPVFRVAPTQHKSEDVFPFFGNKKSTSGGGKRSKGSKAKKSSGRHTRASKVQTTPIKKKISKKSKFKKKNPAPNSGLPSSR